MYFVVVENFESLNKENEMTFLLFKQIKTKQNRKRQSCVNLTQNM